MLDRQVFETLFPIRVGEATLDLVSVGDSPRGTSATVRLIVHEDGAISEIKEQHVLVWPSGIGATDERQRAFWKAWRAHAELALGGEASAMMPADLFADPSRHPLASDAETEEDFAAAFGWIPQAEPLEEEAVRRAHPLARNAQLEQQLGASGDLAAYGVYADWLEENGDPLGGLMARAISEDSGGALADPWLVYCGRHRDVLTGPIGDYGSVLRIEWRRGLIDALDLRCDYDNTVDLEALLEAALAVSASRLVRSITLGCFNFEGGNDYGRMAALIAAEPRYGLRELFIGDVSSEEQEISWTRSGELEPLWTALPNLRTLKVRAGDISLGEMILPTLERLTIESGGFGCPQSIDDADWPSLRHLEIWFGAADYGATGQLGDIRSILAGTRVPLLDSLGLRNCEFADDIVGALPTSGVLPRLRRLDLSMGVLGDAAAQVIVANADKFAHLEQLDVSESFLSEAMIHKLRKICPIEADNQRLEGEDPDDRYVVVGE